MGGPTHTDRSYMPLSIRNKVVVVDHCTREDSYDVLESVCRYVVVICIGRIGAEPAVVQRV